MNLNFWMQQTLYNVYASTPRWKWTMMSDWDLNCTTNEMISTFQLQTSHSSVATFKLHMRTQEYDILWSVHHSNYLVRGFRLASILLARGNMTNISKSSPQECYGRHHQLIKHAVFDSDILSYYNLNPLFLHLLRYDGWYTWSRVCKTVRSTWDRPRLWLLLVHVSRYLLPFFLTQISFSNNIKQCRKFPEYWTFNLLIKIWFDFFVF